MRLLLLAIVSQADALAAHGPSAPQLPQTGNATLDALIYLVGALGALHSFDKVAFWVQKFKGGKNGNSNGENGGGLLRQVVSNVIEQGASLKEMMSALERVEREVREMRIELAAKKGGL